MSSDEDVRPKKDKVVVAPVNESDSEDSYSEEDDEEE